MKTITIAGRNTKNAELRRTQGGDPVVSFSVAVDDGYGQNKATMFFDCSIWGKRGEALQPHIVKGQPITVSGELGKREHEGKTYLTIRVNEVALQGGKPETTQRREPDDGSYGAGSALLDDEIPFAPEFR